MLAYIKKTKAILTSREIGALLLLCSGALILSVTEAFSIGIIIPIISLFMAPEKIQQSAALRWLYEAIGINDYFIFLSALTIMAFALYIFKFIYSVMMLYQQQNVMGKIYNRLTGQALNSYLRKPYNFHLANNSSVIFKNVMLEASNFVYYFLNPVIIIVSEAAILLGICALLFVIYPLPMSLLTVVFGGAALAINFLFKKRIKAYSVQRDIFSGQMYKAALEALGAVKEIKMHDNEDYFVARYLRATESYTNGFMKFSVVNGLPRYIFETLIFTLILVTVLINMYLHRSPAELIPMLTVMGVASLRLLPSTAKIYNSMNLFHYSLNSFDVMYELLRGKDGRAAGRSASCGAGLPQGKKSLIHLSGITFRYDSAPAPVISNLTLSVPQNKIVAFVGRTGSGKSTLIDIITGLLLPSHGNLYFRDAPVCGKEIAEYRKKIGYVPQNIFLIDDTIAANIAFGIHPDQVDMNKLNRSVKYAQLESFLVTLPGGVNTMVGERGAKISGGQKQRIGIARALYRDPEVLILDESTSALDEKTESELYAALKAFKDEMTVILVTHRTSALKKSDLIYVIDNGEIVDNGSFEVVSARSSFFQKIADQRDSVEAQEQRFIKRGQ